MPERRTAAHLYATTEFSPAIAWETKTSLKPFLTEMARSNQRRAHNPINFPHSSSRPRNLPLPLPPTSANLSHLHFPQRGKLLFAEAASFSSRKKGGVGVWGEIGNSRGQGFRTTPPRDAQAAPFYPPPPRLVPTSHPSEQISLLLPTPKKRRKKDSQEPSTDCLPEARFPLRAIRKRAEVKVNQSRGRLKEKEGRRRCLLLTHCLLLGIQTV